LLCTSESKRVQRLIHVTYCILLTAWNLNLRMSFQRWMILYKHVDMVVFILSARVGLVKTAVVVDLHHVKLVF
jgi:hypothetical protein